MAGTPGSAFGDLLDQFLAMSKTDATPAPDAAKTDTNSQSAKSDSSTPVSDKAAAPSADGKKSSSKVPVLPSAITPHLLTDAILNMGQLVPVQPAAPMQGSGTAGTGLQNILKQLGLDTSGGAQGADVMSQGQAAAGGAAASKLDMVMKIAGML